jgi:DNA-binding NarL/FixJ family response regulator
MLKAWAVNLSWQVGGQSKVLSQVEAVIEADGGARPPLEERQPLAAFPGSPSGVVTGETQPAPERRGPSAPGVPGLVEPLTTRELEILALLREPLSPKEIARRLGISYLTVKRHTVNIYGKLDVKTRWDAVNRAVELGILPPR